MDANETGAVRRGLVPGEVICEDSAVAVVVGERTPITVLNVSDRPIQVGSHYHFAEANEGLRFDRAAAWGRRLALPAGTALRFEPGIERDVEVVPLAGRRRVLGLRAIAAGDLDAPGAEATVTR